MWYAIVYANFDDSFHREISLFWNSDLKAIPKKIAIIRMMKVKNDLVYFSLRLFGLVVENVMKRK